MLIAPAAETGPVIPRALRLIATLCCAILVISFAMFARDQMAGASEHQQAEMVAGSTSPSPAASTRRHSQPRRFVDSAAKTLTAPFDPIIKSSNPWVDHGLMTFFALIAYGVGLGYLARYASVR